MTTETDAPAPLPTKAASHRLAVGAAAFVLLTVAVFWYQFGRIPADADRPSWDGLQWRYLILLLFCLPVETLSCAARTWVTSRVLQPSITFWTCIKAEWANVAAATVTPTQAWGGPGQVYLLTRGGASLGTAVTIMLMGFVGTLTALLALAAYALLVAGVHGAWPLFLTVVGSFLGCGSALAAIALWPALLRAPLAAVSRGVWRLRGRPGELADWWPPGEGRVGQPVDQMGRRAAWVVEVIYTYRDNVRRFLRRGKRAFVAVCALSVPFPIARAVTAYAWLRFLGIEASEFRPIFEAQLVLIIFEYFAPSPGGAGVLELASAAVMGAIVPMGWMPYYNLLWRASTLYLPAIAGFFCIAAVLLHDARRVMRPSWGRAAPAQSSSGSGTANVPYARSRASAVLTSGAPPLARRGPLSTDSSARTETSRGAATSPRRWSRAARRRSR